MGRQSSDKRTWNEINCPPQTRECEDFEENPLKRGKIKIWWGETQEDMKRRLKILRESCQLNNAGIVKETGTLRCNGIQTLNNRFVCLCG